MHGKHTLLMAGPNPTASSLCPWYPRACPYSATATTSPGGMVLPSPTPPPTPATAPGAHAPGFGHSTCQWGRHAHLQYAHDKRKWQHSNACLGGITFPGTPLPPTAIIPLNTLVPARPAASILRAPPSSGPTHPSTCPAPAGASPAPPAAGTAPPGATKPTCSTRHACRRSRDRPRRLPHPPAAPEAAATVEAAGAVVVVAAVVVVVVVAVLAHSSRRCWPSSWSRAVSSSSSAHWWY